MNSFVSGLFVICVLISSTNPSLSEEDNGSVIEPYRSDDLSKDTQQVLDLKSIENKSDELEESRSLSHGQQQEDGEEENGDVVAKKTKPLRRIFMGIYKNYKSTYLGNKTLTEYKQTLKETMKNKQQLQQQQQQNESMQPEEPEDEEILQMQADDDDDDEGEAIVTEHLTEESFTTTVMPEIEASAKPAATRKRKHHTKTQKAEVLEPPTEPTAPEANELQYNVGPALNMSLDLQNSLVKVNLDGESLKELVTGRWLSDNSEEGRGKKYEMVTRILPLFILPFLIQSAIVPFLVTKLKLLLMKSMLVGKLAIFLLIISAFRNSNKMMQTYEVAPSYWASEPSRRSEMATAASHMAYNGYRVEGKPTAWIN